MDTPLTGVRVLVVEDDDDNRDLFVTVLEDAGAEVRSAATVGAALDAVQAWSPKVVVSDLFIADAHATTMLQQLKARAELSHLRAIAISGDARAAVREQMLAEGFHVFVVKPADPIALLDAVVREARVEQA